MEEKSRLESRPIGMVEAPERVPGRGVIYLIGVLKR